MVSCLQCVNQGLAEEAIGQEKLLWKLRPKCHKFHGIYFRILCVFRPHDARHHILFVQLRLDHLVLDSSKRIGPLWASTYCDEDMVPKRWFIDSSCFLLCLLPIAMVALAKVGKVKSLARMAHPRLLGRQVLSRYASFVAVRWLRQLEGVRWIL